ncbi:MAG: hypothetical protein RJA22_1358 [Verrucomicrobiota bacterium]|jgi:hypothetical protein
MKKLLLLLLCLAPLLTGCIAAIGNSGLRGSSTLGQQLIDLQRAKEVGALSDEEYKVQRERLLRK